MREKIILVFLIFISSCKKSGDDYLKFNPPPRVSIDNSSEKYFGRNVIDPYRDMEDYHDSLNIDWYKKQSEYAENILEVLPGREPLLNDLLELSKRRKSSFKRINVTSNNKCFFLKKDINDSFYKLYFKDNIHSEEHLLYSPKDFKKETGYNYYISYIKPSWDGKYIVIALSYSGRDLSEMVILDVEKRKALPQTLTNAWPSNFWGVNWLPDNSGFTYLRFSDIDISDPRFKENSQSVLHFIEDNDGRVNYIFGNKTCENLNISKKIYPITKINSDKDKYIIGYLSDVDNYWNAYYAKISDIKKGQLSWKKLYVKEDKIQTTKGYFTANHFVFLSAKGADNKKIMSIKSSELNINKAVTLAKEKYNEVINDFEITSNGIYYSTLKNGVDANLYRVFEGKEERINTPKQAGLINLNNKSAFSDELWVSIEGWTSPYVRYSYNTQNKTFEKDRFSSQVNYPEFENIIAQEVLVKSHDGEEIPLSIIRNKNLKLDGNNPVFIYGYGAYGDIESPYFSSIMLTFVRKGGLFCVAHVRGGGEKGDNWHKGGLKLTKPNSWKDLISCTEYLIDKKITSNQNIAIYGASAGAILVGRAMIERPDLFKVVISEYGYLNPFRGEIIGSAGTNSEEFGSAKDSLECLSLINMDPYLNIKDNVVYPSVYLTVGMNDPQVQPWMPGKFAARLQNKTELKNPVLLLADFETGHGDTSNASKIYEDWANIFSYVFWQTGNPDYQLK